MKNKKWYFGFLGFMGLQGIPALLHHDWIGLSWFAWFVWFMYFFIPFNSSGKEPEEAGQNKETLIEKQAREKTVNKEAILGLLNTQEKLTNDLVEQKLGVSDATAERYLQELEREGKIRQIGITGSGVYYERLNDTSR